MGSAGARDVVHRKLNGSRQYSKSDPGSLNNPLRRAFTLTELAVAVGVIAVLLGILVPAVQHSRAVARRLHCANNLKQIGISNHSYASSHGVFPSEGFDLYDHIGLGFGGANPSLLRCVADPWCGQEEVGRSYLANSGTRFRGSRSSNGYHLMFHPRSPAEFVDGQSSTAAFSERLVAPYRPDRATAEGSPERFLWWTAGAVPKVGGEPAFAAACRDGRTSVSYNWLFAPDTIGIGYDHLLTPNRFGCWNGSKADSDRQTVIVPASSQHGGGVNVLFVDGHVAYIPDAVHEKVWMALGTVNGGETDAEAF